MQLNRWVCISPAKCSSDQTSGLPKAIPLYCKPLNILATSHSQQKLVQVIHCCLLLVLLCLLLVLLDTLCLHLIFLSSMWTQLGLPEYCIPVYLSKYIFIFICACMCVPVSVLHGGLVSQRPGEDIKSWNWSYRWMWIWVLGSHLESSTKADNTLNHWAISPVPKIKMLKQNILGT